jgi:hypothetical protein
MYTNVSLFENRRCIYVTLIQLFTSSINVYHNTSRSLDYVNVTVPFFILVT